MKNKEITNQEPQPNDQANLFKPLLNNRWFLIIAVIFLVVFIGGGVLWWNYFQRSASIPDATQDETSNWQTYTNEEYRLEVKYPNNISVSAGERTDNSLEVLFGSGYSLRVLITPTDAKSVREFSWLNSQQTTLGPYEAIESFSDTPPFNSRTYSLIYNRRLYELYGQIYGEGDMITLSQILSTFRFIDPADTSSWQTYTNEEFGFEVKYPSTLAVREYESTGQDQFISFSNDTTGEETSIDVITNNSKSPDTITWADQAKWPFSDDWRNHFDIVFVAGYQALQDASTGSVTLLAYG